MPPKAQPKPKTRTLPLSDLVARPGRANVLPERARRALREHIQRSGLYPALIVRPHSRRQGKYEILDGQHRAEILRSLGASKARCEIWSVGDGQADVLAATLNRLRGRADPHRRARQVRRIVRRLGCGLAAAALALKPTALQRQLAPLHPPQPEAGGKKLDLQPIFFHLSAEQSDFLKQTLRRFGAGRRRRGEALAELLRAANEHVASGKD